MDNKAFGILLIAAAAVLYLFQNSGGLPIDIRPNIVPAVTFPEACRPAIEAIRAVKIESRDAAELARFYTAFARAVDDDVDNTVDSAETVRSLNRWSGRLYLAESGVFGKYPGLADQVDEAIAQSIGSRRNGGGFDPVSIDVTKKKNLAQALRAIAWAVQQ